MNGERTLPEILARARGTMRGYFDIWPYNEEEHTMNVHTDKLNLKLSTDPTQEFGDNTKAYLAYANRSDQTAKLTCCNVPVSINATPPRTDATLIECQECGATDVV